jgi:hypothetical protein
MLLLFGVLYFTQMRDSTIFYRSFYEAIKDLPKGEQAEVYNAIFEYSLNFNIVELKGLSKTIFTLIKPQIEANIKRYENGNKAKTKQTESKTEANTKQDISKSEANKNDNVNDNVNKNNNIGERKLKFTSTLKPFESKYGKDLLNDFFKYWTEPNKSQTKFRAEMEKTWDVELRLSTWASRDKNFNKQSNIKLNDNLRNVNIDEIKY